MQITLFAISAAVWVASHGPVAGTSILRSLAGSGGVGILVEVKAWSTTVLSKETCRPTQRVRNPSQWPVADSRWSMKPREEQADHRWRRQDKARPHSRARMAQPQVCTHQDTSAQLAALWQLNQRGGGRRVDEGGARRTLRSRGERKL
eukprot:scaffold121972_cov33-Tisochrysis_lutea.AAC.2